MTKPLNNLRDEVLSYAEEQGFHEKPFNFGESLMLIVSELSEALEADRKGKREDERWASEHKYVPPNAVKKNSYKKYIKGTVEEEIADAVIRLCDLAGIYKIDLDWPVRAKMAYNNTRPYKHGKHY
jgi:NTP pyrophosphatase (non-canonical NTP hydrolase)